MLFVLVIVFLQSSSILTVLLTNENRIPSRNLTCQHDTPSMTTIVPNCEACLVTSRNYGIDTRLSLAGQGQTGFSYTCLKVNDVEGYYENILRECRNFPRDKTYGYDDFCIASPFSYLRGSYRVCLCITDTCNFNYEKCIQETKLGTISTSPSFTKTVAELTETIKCYPPENDLRPVDSSGLIPLCGNYDDACKNYASNNAVLCVISVDRNNRTIRQSLTPSVYTAYLIKYKTEFCNSFSSKSKSVYFSQCRSNNDICMCTSDACDNDLETCRRNHGIYKKHYTALFILLLLLNTSI